MRAAKRAHQQSNGPISRRAGRLAPKRPQVPLEVFQPVHLLQIQYCRHVAGDVGYEAGEALLPHHRILRHVAVQLRPVILRLQGAARSLG